MTPADWPTVGVLAVIALFAAWLIWCLCRYTCHCDGCLCDTYQLLRDDAKGRR